MARATRKSDVSTLADLAAVQDTVVPLFPAASADPDGPGRIVIARVSPNDGILCDAPQLNIDEMWLKSEFGGGTYELILYSKRGEQIAAPRRVKIAGAPLPRAELEVRAADVEASAQQERDKTLGTMELQSRMFREQLAMLRADSDAQRERAKLELELSMRRSQLEADERETRERQRFEREMQRERERSERDREREKEALQAQVAQQQQFMLAVQALNKESTAMMMGVLQSQNSKTDPLEAAVKINSMVESRLELEKGDPAERNAQQMWSLVGKGMEMVAQERAAPTPAQAPQGPQAARPPAAVKAPQGAAAELPIPQVAKQRLASILQKIAASGADPMEVLAGLDEGDLAIVERDVYEEGQEALKELEHGDPDPKATPVASRQREHVARPNETPLGESETRDGEPGTPGALSEPDAGGGDPSEAP